MNERNSLFAMKVKCPNCAARYNVDDNKIPDKGTNAKCPKCNNKYILKKPTVISQKSTGEPLGSGGNFTQADESDKKLYEDKEPIRDVRKYKTPVIQCVRIGCKFWVEPSDLFCPNCGLTVPKTALSRFFQKIRKNPFGCLIAIPVILFALPLLAILIQISPTLAMVSSGIIIILALIRRRKSAKKKIEDRPIDNLCKKEKRLGKLLDKLHQKNLKFSRNIKAIEKRQGRGLLPIKSKLEKGAEIIEYQTKQAEIGLRQIELLRWANTLKPVTSKYYEISTEKECVNLLKQLKKIKKNGLKIQKKWNKRKDLLALEKGEKQIGSLEQTVQSCEVLIEELMAKQADFDIQSISNMNFPSDFQDNTAINQMFTMMAMAEIQENGIKTINDDIEKELSVLEAKIEMQNAMD